MNIQKPDEFRDNMRLNINKFIKKKSISVNLEKAIFNYSIESKKKKNSKKMG